MNRGISRRHRLCSCEALEARAMLSAAADDSPAAQTTDAIPGIAALPQSDDHHSVYPGGVTVTDTEIITPTETIPRFVAQPTITAIRSGNWTSPTVWSAGRAPTSGDRVLIPEGVNLFYGTQSNAHLEAVEVGGKLSFSRASNTRLIVGTLTVMPTGTLQIGTAAAPVKVGVTAELVIADQALDLANDPRQYGTGLIALGTVTIHGSVLNQTWTRLAAEPRAGQHHLVVSNPDPTWQPGDTLILPDTRQVPTLQSGQFENGQFPPHWEVVTILRLVGKLAPCTSITSSGPRILRTPAINFNFSAIRWTVR